MNRPREEVQRLWSSDGTRPEYIHGLDADVTFRDAPGDRGTEIHVAVGADNPVKGIFGRSAMPKVKDDLRRFKALVETGVIPRSDGSPEGERAERKLKQRPAQPLEESELEEVGAR